jgi:hypothetical protein
MSGLVMKTMLSTAVAGSRPLFSGNILTTS